MKKIKQILTILTLIALGFFISPLKVSAADIDIVISEIGAYEPGDHEWLEIYNTGSDPVDLSGWKFTEDSTNHGLTAFQNDFIIDPGEFAIIADVAANFKTDYPDFTGTILDSSWTTLNEDGEEIALKNKNLEIIESFTYLPCPNSSLQRIDLTVNDYSETNWLVHATANSAGRANEIASQNPDNQGEDPPADEPDDPDTPTGDTEPDIPSQPSPGTIVINEFVSDPSDGEVEWIELYNQNDFRLDLTGWKIIDGSNTATTLEGEIEANSINPYYVIEKPKGALNNSGDVIILQNDNEEVFATVYYGNWTAPTGTVKAPLASDPNSTARQIDGDTNFVVTQTPTKGAQNIYTPLPSPATPISSSDDNLNQYQIPETQPKQIIFNEIMPNPLGNDAEGEWIELKNTGAMPFDLAGWQLSSTSKITYKISKESLGTTIIKPGEYLLIRRQQSGIALNNIKDTVKLISNTNKTIQTLKFGEDPSIPENVSYSLASENSWFWSTTPTPGKENIINKLNHAPLIAIYCPKQALKGELIVCDASDSYDPENDKLQFTWEANDTIFTNPIIQLQFNQTGTFTINLTVSDKYLSAQQTIKIKITENKEAAIPAVKTTTVTKAKAAATTKAETIEQTAADKKPLSEESVTKVDLKEIKNLNIGTTVITQGVVSALPNIFGKTIMYLAGSGTQLYMSKADWPDLEIGDLVEVNGTVGEIQGNKRLKLSSAQNIVVLNKEPEPEPQAIKINEINDAIIDYLIQIQGTLIEKNSSKFYLQDETGEAEVYINTNTKISKGNFSEGDNLTITGILRKYNNVFQVMPRFTEDLIKNLTTKEQEAALLPAQKQTTFVLNYLLATAVVLGLGLTTTFIYKNKINKDKSENG